MDLDKKRKQLCEEIGKQLRVDIVPESNPKYVYLRVYFTDLGSAVVKLMLERELKDGSLGNELVALIRNWFFTPPMIKWAKEAKVRVPSNIIFVDRTYVKGKLITADCINNEPYMPTPDCRQCSIEIWSQKLKRL